MKVLFLGPPDSPLLDFLRAQEDDVAQTADPVEADRLAAEKVDFLVSYGYRHILPKPVIDRYAGRAVNLHISLLPWNRGADPNLWSFVERTPKGVSIHYLAVGIDMGDLIAQREVTFTGNETLQSSYTALHATIRELFIGNWSRIRAGTAPGTPQPAGGSFHRVKDRERIAHLLVDGWGTKVSLLSAASD